ncbi:DUF4405 domain-containing protein [Thiococcus pfennigii]|uniref:DUF4405 domain-containing protein n=1 Tax=Thiococcus pfennigii TaxID=1057 RepID=UPI0019031672|nr:DUF4405 domain-containing protein [Thiococcus pfennigii]MBK1733067.1 hypothetical protein [Thiococcus pfennigii]
MTTPRRRLSLRSVIAFLVTWSFLVLTDTGLVLYVLPHGRVAYWTHWSLLGLDKDQWAGVHMMFGGLFIVTGALHLYFNWKPFTRYLAERIGAHMRPSRELFASLGLALAILVLAIRDLPPVSWVFDLNATLKAAWVTDPTLEPPYGHAEESTLAGLARRLRLDLPKAEAALDAAGLAVRGPQDTLEQIARRNATTPMAVYALIRDLEIPEPPRTGPPTPEEVEARWAGTGLGQLTLAEVAARVGLGTDEALARLAADGIAARPGERLRPLAERAGVTPIDLLKAMLVPGFEPPLPAGD